MLNISLIFFWRCRRFSMCTPAFGGVNNQKGVKKPRSMAYVSGGTGFKTKQFQTNRAHRALHAHIHAAASGANMNTYIRINLEPPYEYVNTYSPCWTETHVCITERI